MPHSASRHLSPSELIAANQQRATQRDGLRPRPAAPKPSWLQRLAAFPTETIQRARHRIAIDHAPEIVARELNLPIEIVSEMRERSLKKRREAARVAARIAARRAAQNTRDS